MKELIVMTGIIILCWTLIGCNNSVKNIKAQYFTISYGESIYDAMNKIDTETVDLLVNQYNEIELTGTTSEEINYANAITITFIYNDQSLEKSLLMKKEFALNNEVENRIISEKVNFMKQHSKYFMI